MYEESSLFLADYVIIIRNVMREMFITTPEDIRKEIQSGTYELLVRAKVL
jgi:hypothetical protein